MCKELNIPVSSGAVLSSDGCVGTQGQGEFEMSTNTQFQIPGAQVHPRPSVGFDTSFNYTEHLLDVQ